MIHDDKKFIFVHIPKTGGSSIESFFGYDLFDKQQFSNEWVDPVRALGLDRKAGLYLQHLTMDEIDARYPGKSQDYFTFSFVRNPWDRAVSDYLYIKRYTRIRTFKQYLVHSYHHNKTESFQRHVLDQHSFVYNHDKCTVDFLGRFETLQQDFDKVCMRLDIPNTALPVVNKNDRDHYTEYYDDETRDIVSQRYARDIELFNYTFND